MMVLCRASQPPLQPAAHCSLPILTCRSDEVSLSAPFSPRTPACRSTHPSKLLHSRMYPYIVPHILRLPSFIASRHAVAWDCARMGVSPVPLRRHTRSGATRFPRQAQGQGRIAAAVPAPRRMVSHHTTNTGVCARTLSVGEQSVGERSVGERSVGERSMGDRSVGDRSVGALYPAPMNVYPTEKWQYGGMARHTGIISRSAARFRKCEATSDRPDPCFVSMCDRVEIGQSQRARLITGSQAPCCDVARCAVVADCVVETGADERPDQPC